METKTPPTRPFKIGAQLAISTRSRKSHDETRFLALLQDMTPRDRRILAVVVSRVADTEALGGQAAALQLIDDIEAAIRTSDH